MRGGMPARAITIAAAAFAALAFVVFVFRGPLRALQHGYDLSWNYLGTQVWLKGGGLNAYSLQDSLAQRGPGYPPTYDLMAMGTPYPPAVFPVTAPFAFFEWQTASLLLALFSAALYGLTLATFAHRYLSGRNIVLLFLGAALLMYPVHTGIALLQNAVPSVALSLLAMSRKTERRNEAIQAMLLAGFAMAFKP